MASIATETGTDWKDRYFKVVNEFDDQERAWNEQLGRVTRDMLRLLDTFRGQAADFDRDLDAVNAAAGKGRFLTTQLSELVIRAASLPDADADADNEQNPDDSGDRESRLALLKLLDALVLPTQFATQAGATRAELDPASATIALSTSDAVQRIAALLTAALTAAGASATTGADDARDTLQTLVDHLSLPESAASRVGELTTAVQQADAGSGLRQIAKDLANFLHDYIASIRSELLGVNGFLVQIKQRLDGVSEHLGQESDNRARQQAARAALGDDVRLSLQEIRGQVSDSDDVHTLKATIQQQLAQLDDRIVEYVATENQHTVERGAADRDLLAQIETLQRESGELRDKLVAAQLRAARDALTGLPNRAAYDARLRKEIKRRQRDGTPLSVVVVDLDKFKSINDTWGHQAGDRVLKHVARELRHQIRETDFFARFGGEEFVLLLPDTSLDAALGLADNLRRHIDACQFSYQQSPVAVTISCGVAEFGLEESGTDVFARADAGLYEAKDSGRNRCIARR